MNSKHAQAILESKWDRSQVWHVKAQDGACEGDVRFMARVLGRSRGGHASRDNFHFTDRLSLASQSTQRITQDLSPHECTQDFALIIVTSNRQDGIRASLIL